MRTRERQFGILGMMLILLLVVPPVRDILERSMTTHVAVQLAGLAAAGWLSGRALRRRLAPACDVLDAHGSCGLAICLLSAIFWMLPRTLDEVLLDLRMEAAKFLTVPLLVGFPLALSWPRLNPIFRGALEAGLISKLTVLGWIYVASPVRLCTNYFQGDQVLLGELFCLLAVTLAVAWSLPCFLAGASDRNSSLSFPQQRCGSTGQLDHESGGCRAAEFDDVARPGRGVASPFRIPVGHGSEPTTPCPGSGRINTSSSCRSPA